MRRTVYANLLRCTSSTTKLHNHQWFSQPSALAQAARERYPDETVTSPATVAP